MVKRFLLIPLMVVLVSGLIFAGCAAPAPGPEPTPIPTPVAPEPEVFKWRAQEPFGPGDFTTSVCINPTWDMIERVSNGQIQIEAFPAESLVPFEDMVDAVSSGALDAAGIPSCFHTGTIGKVGFVEMGLPYAWMTLDDAYSINYEHGLVDLMRETYAPHNIYYLGSTLSARFTLFTNFPVNKIEDLEGKKIRATGSYAPVMDKLGASVISLPPPEIYVATKLGTVDGFIYSIPELEGMGFKDVVRYMIFPPMNSNIGTNISINQDSWNALPADLQNSIIKGFMDDLKPHALTLMGEDDKAIKSSGIEVLTLPDAEVQKVREVALSYWNELAQEDAICAKAVQILKDYHGMK